MEISDFSRVIINVGSQHRLPLDCSFKQFEDMVSAKTGEPFSRRMMRNAWEALPINEAKDSSRESVYDYLNQNRYEAYDKETKEKTPINYRFIGNCKTSCLQFVPLDARRII